LVALEERHGSLLRGMAAAARQRRAEAAARGEPAPRPGRMWSFREGLRLLAETLAERARPVLGVTVRRVGTDGPAAGRPRGLVHGDGQERWQADAVVLTCPAYRQAALLDDVDRELAEQVGAIPYNRVVVVALGYRREDVPHRLDGFG